MNPEEPPPPPSLTQVVPGLIEVKYSLPEMLAELKLERAASIFAMEKMDQVEIGKLFKAKKTRRGQSKK